MTGKVKFDQMKRKAPPAQALVELAIILPILLLLILGAMDFGRMFITKNLLTNAAREGANYLAYNPKDKDLNYIETRAWISEVVDPNLVTSDFFEKYDTSGDKYVEVTVSITDIPLIFGGFYQRFFNMGEKLTLTSTVKMLVQ